MQLTARQDYLDWLRILAILGVLLFHSAMPFATDEWWHIKDKQTSNVLLEFNFWLSRFRMPLLFFISGAVTYFMLQKRSALSFAGLRFKRLFIPLLFGMLVIVPPQIYMERLTQGFKGSFWDFYPSIFSGEAYPKGNTSWHHLWFIAYLFLYNLIAAPLFAWLARSKDKAFVKQLDWIARGRRIYLLMIPSVLAYTSLVLKFPQTNDLLHDWAYHIYWFLFVAIGFLCIMRSAIMESLERNRRSLLAVGMLLFIIMNYIRWNSAQPWNVNPQDWRSMPETYLYLAMYPAVAWCWVLSLTGYGRKYLNKRTAFSAYATEAIYPFYILHQTIIVILAYYVVQVPDDVSSKYLFITLATLLLSVGIYHLFIKPYNIMRFLFGMKPLSSRPRTANKAEPQSVNIQPQSVTSIQ